MLPEKKLTKTCVAVINHHHLFVLVLVILCQEFFFFPPFSCISFPTKVPMKVQATWMPSYLELDNLFTNLQYGLIRFPNPTIGTHYITGTIRWLIRTLASACTIDYELGRNARESYITDNHYFPPLVDPLLISTSIFCLFFLFLSATSSTMGLFHVMLCYGSLC